MDNMYHISALLCRNYSNVCLFQTLLWNHYSKEILENMICPYIVINWTLYKHLFYLKFMTLERSFYHHKSTFAKHGLYIEKGLTESMVDTFANSMRCIIT